MLALWIAGRYATTAGAFAETRFSVSYTGPD